VKTGINRVLVIIPCYNEQDNILPLLNNLRSLKVESCELTLLPVNDASTDETAGKLATSGCDFLSNAVNLGIGGTVQLGFLYAIENDFDFAVQVDGDGQHPAAELPVLLAPLLSATADIASGTRFDHKEGFKSTPMRRLGIRFFYRLNRLLCGVEVRDATSGFRAYNRKAIELAAGYYPDEYPEPEVILYMSHHKMRIVEVPVSMAERASGVSSISAYRTVYYMAKVSLNIIFLHLKMKFHG
jgi:glycosyltransferase involved in cell wall biosynthesis